MQRILEPEALAEDRNEQDPHQPDHKDERIQHRPEPHIKPAFFLGDAVDLVEAVRKRVKAFCGRPQRDHDRHRDDGDGFRIDFTYDEGNEFLKFRRNRGDQHIHHVRLRERRVPDEYEHDQDKRNEGHQKKIRARRRKSEDMMLSHPAGDGKKAACEFSDHFLFLIRDAVPMNSDAQPNARWVAAADFLPSAGCMLRPDIRSSNIGLPLESM